MAGFAALVAMLAAMAAQDAPPQAGDDAPAQAVEAQVDSEARLTVAVRVHDKGPYRFLVDTGAERTVLSSTLATALELPLGPPARVVGIAGAEDVRTVHVENIALGSKRLTRLNLPLLERRHMGADGIIGTDSLQGQRVLLDFANDRLEIGDARALGGNSGFEIVVRARRRSGQLIITRARIDGVLASVILDTGAGMSVGNRALQTALRKRGSETMPVTIRSVTGQAIVADIGFSRKLDIENLTVTNLIIAYADSPAFARLGLARRPAVFLGMRELRLFNRVAIDFSRHSVLFDLPPEP